MVLVLKEYPEDVDTADMVSVHRPSAVDSDRTSHDPNDERVCTLAEPLEVDRKSHRFWTAGLLEFSHQVLTPRWLRIPLPRI